MTLFLSRLPPQRKKEILRIYLDQTAKLTEAQRLQLPIWREVIPFVRGYLKVPTPKERIPYLREKLSKSDSALVTSLRRAGGLHRAFKRVIGPGLDAWDKARFATPECPDPGPKEIAAGVVMATSFLGLLWPGLDLVYQETVYEG